MKLRSYSNRTEKWSLLVLSVLLLVIFLMLLFIYDLNNALNQTSKPASVYPSSYDAEVHEI